MEYQLNTVKLWLLFEFTREALVGIKEDSYKIGQQCVSIGQTGLFT